MKIKNFSPKQIKVLTWWYNSSKIAIICDGAIRSGKTFCLGISFILWAFYEFNGVSFGMCGKTIKSLKRNVLETIYPVLSELGFKFEYKISENLVTIYFLRRINKFYIFGGKDESSASLIQGMTLSGVLFDEVALMPQSFVEQALARCSEPKSRFWFNCNPENPSHWFYQEWILPYKNKNALLINFELKDNPSLSQEIISRYKQMYTGNFYRRFIEGKWCYGDGLIYPFMANYDAFCSPPLNDFEKFALSCDYGVVNPISCGLWAKSSETWYRIDEYYYDSKNNQIRIDQEHLEAIFKLINGKKISFVAIDPSAAGFSALMRKHKFNVIPAKNDVNYGICLTSEALKTGKIKICANCADSIREFSLYRWFGGTRDSPHKENDHAMDDIRYFVSVLNSKLGADTFFAMSILRKR
ncbi:MAG: PBSX family phage terminase large subunit [Oscillospiraceae bacterium]|jgi:PBSX family phage terminase large subunit|nr:PBSX family phage terminase large subunit [Oscillospiraceae bacterium]